MKNKRTKSELKVESKVSAHLKTSPSIRNREQLRRKLKDLLEKDRSYALNLKKTEVVPGVMETVHKSTKVANNQEGTSSPKRNGIKKKKKRDSPTNAALKRKQMEKPTPPDEYNMAFKPSSSQNSLLNIPSKKCKSNNLPQKLGSPEKVPSSVEDPTSIKKPKNKTLSIQEEKVSQITEENAVKNKKSRNSTKLVAAKRREKQNQSLYRGPLRPSSSDCDEDDSDVQSVRIPKRKILLSRSNETRKTRGSDTESDNDITIRVRPPRRAYPRSQAKKNDFGAAPRDDSNIFTVRLPSEEKSLSDDTWTTSRCDNESEWSDETIIDEDSSEFSCSSIDSSFDDDDKSDSSSDFEHFSDYDSDDTYQLPDGVPEDIYVAKGEAIKHDFSESSEIMFDSDNSCPQIIEITNNDKEQKIRNALTWTDKEGSKVTKTTEKGDDSVDSCPELVPIDHDFDTETDNDSDCCSDCISDKYIEQNFYEPMNKNKNLRMVPKIFKADKNASSEFDSSLLNSSDMLSEHEVEGSPLERIANVSAIEAAYNVITVKNNNQPDFGYERKLNGVTNSKTANAFKESIDIHENWNQSNWIADNLKLVDHQASENSTEKENTPDVDQSKMGDTYVRKINVQTDSEHSLSSTIEDLLKTDNMYARKTDDHTRQEFTATNESFKNKTHPKTLFFNAINSNQVIVLLKEHLYLYGTLKLKLLAGGLDIFGYNPKPNEILELFSPRGYGSLKIEPSMKSGSHSLNENEFNALTANFLKLDIESVRSNYDSKHDAIIILERNDNSKKVNMLRKYMVENLFPNMNIMQSDRPFYTSEFLLRCVLTPTSDKPLIINPPWRNIPLTNSSRTMIIGGKSVGKSSLVRFLSNVYLNTTPKVLLVDLDIGQPEMFVPQTVSVTTLTAPLFGPGYLSAKEPDKAFLVGQINVVLQPQRYIQSVEALITFCKQNAEYKDIPWIVNTMGYNKGFGDEIIAIICRLLNPSNIVQLESRNDINNFDVIMSKENLRYMQLDIIGDMFCNNDDYHPDHTLTLISSVTSSHKKCQGDWDLKPRDVRLAMIISRLSAVLKGQAEWLADIKPVCASIDDLKLVNLGDEDLTTEDLLKGLVGNLVYLCKQNSSSVNECLGIGIVRGIDFPLKQIYLLPAIALNLLEEVNCLAICGIPLPSSILINQGPKVKGVASYVYNTINRSASMHIKQIYNRPQNFLTGRFKSIID